MTITSPAAPLAGAAPGRLVTPTGRLLLPADIDRDTWLAERTHGIGSSDVPAILGVDDYRSPLHVWHDKRGELPDDAGEPAHWGNVLEGPIAGEWARRNRSVIAPIGIVAHATNPVMRCTLDRLITECPLPETARQVCALEVKCRSAFKAARWHAGAPDDVLAQVLWQLAVTGLDHMHYAVLIGGNDYRQGVIRADDHADVMADIVTGCLRFWDEHVAAGIPPAPSGDPERLAEMHRRMHPNRSGVVELGDGDAFDDLQDYERARLAEAAAKRRKNAAKARLLAHLGDARTATFDGHRAYALEPTERSTPDLARLAERWPDAYADCVTTTTGERLDIESRYRHKPVKES